MVERALGFLGSSRDDEPEKCVCFEWVLGSLLCIFCCCGRELTSPLGFCSFGAGMRDHMGPLCLASERLCGESQTSQRKRNSYRPETIPAKNTSAQPVFGSGGNDGKYSCAEGVNRNSGERYFKRTSTAVRRRPSPF